MFMVQNYSQASQTKNTSSVIGQCMIKEQIRKAVYFPVLHSLQKRKE